MKSKFMAGQIPSLFICLTFHQASGFASLKVVRCYLNRVIVIHFAHLFN